MERKIEEADTEFGGRDEDHEDLRVGDVLNDPDSTHVRCQTSLSPMCRMWHGLWSRPSSSIGLSRVEPVKNEWLGAGFGGQ